MAIFGQQMGVVISVKLLDAVSEGDFAEQETANRVEFGGVAVVGRLADHICEVNSLAEHVPCCWRLRGSDPESAAQDPHKVSQSRTVP